MVILFQKISFKLSNQPSPKEKLKSCGWYVVKLFQKLPPLKKSKSSKKYQKEEDKIKRRLTEANQMWNDWKFQIHWNKLEWVHQRSCDKRRIYFVCLQKYIF